MDTRDKRSSAVHVSLPWRGLLPLPDGTLDQGDRQHAALMYRGIAVSEPSPLSPVGTTLYVELGNLIRLGVNEETKRFRMRIGRP